MTRKAGRRREPRPDAPPRRRPLLGDDSWLEIVNKSLTIGALVFGIWVYFHSVQPVFEKEEALANAQQRVTRMENEVTQLQRERELLQQQVKDYHAEAAAHRHGIVLGHLIDIKRELQRQALSYERAGEAIDLRTHSLSYLDASITRLGSPPEGSIQSYEKEALEFSRRFVDSLPPGAADPALLDGVLDAYDRQEQLGVAGR